MAESAVGFLLQTLGSLVQQEASLLQGLDGSFGEIQLKLQFMRSFLKDADRRKSSEDRVRTWVKQVRDVTYEAEDIIDKYMYYIAKQHKGGGLLRGALNNTVLFPKRYYYKHKIASELQLIKSKIQNISEESKTYGFQEEGSTSEAKGDGHNWQRARENARFISDDKIVGIERNKDFLIRRLIDERPERVVLSVVGMGGLGKTTLVTTTYNCPKVKNHFDCHAWITVSQSYKLEELLRSLIKELYKSEKEAIPHGINEMNANDLVETVGKYLQTKRYVIVLDDVWAADVWNDIQVALPNNGRGGRILLTTRIHDVALSFENKDVLNLRPLGKDDAWLLFCRKAFTNESCPPELKQSAQNLAKKCEGLPLAIVTIGGLMSRKEKSSLEWKKVENSLKWQLNNNAKLGSMKNILLLSFNDLPYKLKLCFLYCSLFPEDYKIPQKRLIRLWLAEGFIEKPTGLTLEEVAADCINELICRSLLHQVVDDIRSRKFVRMHDVLRELALAIGLEESFCNICDREDETQENEARRVLMHNSIVNIQSSTCHLRSLMLFSIEIPALSLLNITSSIKLLRVLDLRDSSIERVPDELVELFNLRYLCLKNTNIKELPKSIARLRNLQTLDIRNSNIKTLPRGVETLKNLRHLFTYRKNLSKGFDNYDYAESPNGICNLKCLQTLACIGANDDIVGKVGNLTQLRVLEITSVRRSHGKELCASLQKMRSLLGLLIKAAAEEEILDLDALSDRPPAHLQNLYLSGHLERLPGWIGSLQNLTQLSFHWSQLNEDPLLSLQALPNLVNLSLEKAYVGKELRIRRGCFLKLKSLAFVGLPELNRMKIEEKSMNCIENLLLINCPKLKSIPEGIQNLGSLQFLYLKDMSGELLGRIRRNEGGICQRIPNILLR